MRLACIQPRLRFGDLAYNTEQIAACVARAANQGAHIAVAPHLALLGGWLMEGWSRDAIVEAQLQALRMLQRKGLIIMLLTSGVKFEGEKMQLVGYAVPAGENQSIETYRRGMVCAIGGELRIQFDWCDEVVSAGCVSLEDGISIRLVFDTTYSGTGRMALRGGHSDIPWIVARHGGIRGHHLCVSGSEFSFPTGRIRMPAESDVLKVVDLSCPAFESTEELSQEALWYRSLALGVREYFLSQGLRRALVGLSGGIDSALVLTLAVEALGSGNVTAVFMPTRYTSSVSSEDAEALANRLGVSYRIIPIDTLCASIEGSLGSLLDGNRGTAEENIQARLRSLLLMAIANKHGLALLNTSNKSEVAVGYTTLYGDMCGVLSVIGDLYKTEVYRLCRWINRAGEIIPSRTITRAPSAELRPDQKDEDSLPPYEVLDAILGEILEGKRTSMPISQSERTQVIGLLESSAFKRQQMPPILKLGKHAFQAEPEGWILGAKYIQ